MKPVAFIQTPYREKFGIPRQAGVVKAIGKIVMEKEFRNPDCLKGIEEFSHLWILWEFSKNKDVPYRMTVRPPRLGGKEKRGVFATRAPIRPNPIGLSVVRLLRVEWDSPKGPVLHVEGVDMLDGTPIFDIKPYIPYSDAIDDARGGFTERKIERVAVVDPQRVLEKLSKQMREGITESIALDPRPAYQNEENKVYYLLYEQWEVTFIYQNDHFIVLDCFEKYV